MSVGVHDGVRVPVTVGVPLGVCVIVRVWESVWVLVSVIVVVFDTVEIGENVSDGVTTTFVGDRDCVLAGDKVCDNVTSGDLVLVFVSGAVCDADAVTTGVNEFDVETTAVTELERVDAGENVFDAVTKSEGDCDFEINADNVGVAEIAAVNEDDFVSAELAENDIVGGRETDTEAVH